MMPYGGSPDGVVQFVCCVLAVDACMRCGHGSLLTRSAHTRHATNRYDMHQFQVEQDPVLTRREADLCAPVCVRVLGGGAVGA